MKQKLAMIAATLALGFFAVPAIASDVTNGNTVVQVSTNGGPGGYGGNYGGPTRGCGNCSGSHHGGGHNKNGGGGHNKNGGGNGGGGGNNTSDHILCYVGDRAVYASSVRHCRKLVYAYNYGYSNNGGGYGDGGGYGHRDGYSMSRATRMQLRKRARRGHDGYVANGGGRKVHGRKLRRGHARRGHGGGGKTIIVNNYGGVVQIVKSGGY
jgi:hypothetical protein